MNSIHARHRGCRLAFRIGNHGDQARAIFEAAVAVAQEGIKVLPEVMIPLTGTRQENGESGCGSAPRGRGSLRGTKRRRSNTWSAP